MTRRSHDIPNEDRTAVGVMFGDHPDLIRLGDSRVLVVGSGRSAVLVAHALAESGIGAVRMVAEAEPLLSDQDRVSPPHRLGYSEISIDFRLSSDAVSGCRIHCLNERLSSVNVESVLDGCSMILMGKTNPITRVLINRMSIQKRLPLVYGTATDFTGMVTTIVPDQTPCLECLFGRKEMEENAIGMVEPTYSVVASIQSLEAVKILLGIGPLLLNRLLIINGMSQSYRKIELTKNPHCPACSPR